MNAYLSLAPTVGPPQSAITVTGDLFNPRQNVSLFWDTHDKVLGSATSDASGHFITSVKPPDNESPGVHQICASVPPGPCAQFQLLPKTTPSPAQPSPSSPPQPSPSPAASPPAPAPPASTTQLARPNPVAMLFTPPFIAFPMLFLLSVLVAIAMWARGPLASLFSRPPAIPEATVTHRTRRLEEPQPKAPPPEPANLEQPEPEPPPLPPPVADEPPDLPEPGE